MVREIEICEINCMRYARTDGRIEGELMQGYEAMLWAEK